jgi:hypothetical protein
VNKEDLVYHKALMKLLDEATFELKAREVGAYVSVYNWAKNIPNKLQTKVAPKAKK